MPTVETLAAADLLRRHLPELKVRVVNIVDLMRLQDPAEHSHGLPDREFDALFTPDRPDRDVAQELLLRLACLRVWTSLTNGPHTSLTP